MSHPKFRSHKWGLGLWTVGLLGDSLHSSDIAFKPNDDGWGYTKRYASGWDRIFSNKEKVDASEPPTPTAQPEQSVSRDAKLSALQTARDVGALSEDLFQRALREL